MLLLLSCSDYDLASPVGPEVERKDSGSPAVEVDDTAPPRDTAAVDTAFDPPADTGDYVVDDCQDGYFAYYYNLPADHPDVEIEDAGGPDDVPSNHDWWDEAYYAFEQEDPGLEFGDQWWPVNTGLPGDPQYFAVRWVAILESDSDLIVPFEMGSDDDSWAYLDGELMASLPGIHGVEATQFYAPLTQGQHKLELFMAERHTSNSGFWFKWLAEGVRIFACPDGA